MTVDHLLVHVEEESAKVALDELLPRILGDVTFQVFVYQGGTAEALERILQRAGYFVGGLEKRAAARAIAGRMQVDRNRSPSFAKLVEVLRELAPGAA